MPVRPREEADDEHAEWLFRDKDDEELKMTIRHREHAMRIIDGIKSYPCSFLFGEVSSNYIVFLIDCSGSMVGSEGFVGG